jgi:hypothetical protein
MMAVGAHAHPQVLEILVNLQALFQVQVHVHVLNVGPVNVM